LLAVFAVCAQSSAVLPYASWPYGSPLAYNAWAPSAYNSWAHAAPITQYSSYPAWSHAAPAISYAAHVAAPVAYAAAPVVHAPVAHGASYTAANRGSVHTAPLPGHAVSQTSLNLAPAPGTY